MAAESPELHWQKNSYEVTISPCTVRLIGFGLFVTESGNDLTLEEFNTDKAEKAVLEHFSPAILKEIKKAAALQKEIIRMNGAYIVKVVPPEISFGINDRYGGSGTSCSIEEFLEGNFNDFIIEHFGYTGLVEISGTAQNILKNSGKEIPSKNKFLTAAETLAGFSDKSADLIIQWECGDNNGLKYIARIYGNSILWQQETDKHHIGDINLTVQSFEDFKKNGAPDEFEFRISLPEKYCREILDWIELDSSTQS